MNSAEVLRRLFRERKEWKASENLGPEVYWTLRGIDNCIRHVKNIVRDQRSQERLRRPAIYRWRARDLFFAIRNALVYIKRGDRKKAISMLERIVRLVDEDATKRRIA